MPLDATPMPDLMLPTVRRLRQLIDCRWGKGMTGFCITVALRTAVDEWRLSQWETFRLKIRSLWLIRRYVPRQHYGNWLSAKIRWPTAIIAFNDAPVTTKADVLQLCNRIIHDLETKGTD